MSRRDHGAGFVISRSAALAAGVADTAFEWRPAAEDADGIGVPMLYAAASPKALSGALA